MARTGNDAPSRGEVWELNLDPTIGREQAGTRPAWVVSVDKFNEGPSELVVVLPITSRNKGQPLHVPVDPSEGGLTVQSYIKCDDIRSVSRLRLKRRCGRVSTTTMNEVERRLSILLGI